MKAAQEGAEALAARNTELAAKAKAPKSGPAVDIEAIKAKAVRRSKSIQIHLLLQHALSMFSVWANTSTTFATAM
ncbi:hypothetical protein HED55_00260 [Ochrobactrum haematophilum]|uniref:Uncharacterized protein n=1 Tax=Brucella haematophila TaxID=419474 RepID=A0ABX1DHC9_9HYPH|nr:hypothetical protein [Brucella haematophila]